MAVERLVLACMPRWNQSWANEGADFLPCHYTWKAMPGDLIDYSLIVDNVWIMRTTITFSMLKIREPSHIDTEFDIFKLKE